MDGSRLRVGVGYCGCSVGRIGSDDMWLRTAAAPFYDFIETVGSVPW